MSTYRRSMMIGPKFKNVFMRFREQELKRVPIKLRTFSNSRTSLNDLTSSTPVKLAYASYESINETTKQPILIMHGLFGSKNNWNTLSKSIHQKTERKVIAIDARNHGDSPHSSEMSYKHMARDVTKLLHDLELNKAIMIGHSMGGSVMMYMALNYPELIEKLIVVDMSPIGPSPSLVGLSSVFKAMRSITLEGVQSLTKARKMAENQLELVVKPLALRQFLSMNLVEAESGKYKWRVNLPVLEEKFATNIAVFPNSMGKMYNGPALFIGGSNSDYIRVQDHPAIKKLFPRAVFHYIAGANHWVHADKPVEFLDVLTSFVNKRES